MITNYLYTSYEKNQSIKKKNIMLIIKIKLPLERRFPPTRKKGVCQDAEYETPDTGFPKKDAHNLKIKNLIYSFFKKMYNIVKYKH